MKSIVIKIGGHILPTPPNFNVDKIREYAGILKKAWKDGFKITIVVGGGETARTYVKAAEELNASEAIKDQLGIEATRLNAKLLALALGEAASQTIPENIKEIIEAAEKKKIIVLGGLQPGQSTDAVAAITAEITKAEIMIKATDVKGVYTTDPKKNRNAKFIPEMKIKDLIQIIIEEEIKAGKYKLIDPIALKILERSKIPLRIIDGRNPENILKAIKGENIGTLVKP